jgi:hypothetical protein
MSSRIGTRFVSSICNKTIVSSSAGLDKPRQDQEPNTPLNGFASRIRECHEVNDARPGASLCKIRLSYLLAVLPAENYFLSRPQRWTWLAPPFEKSDKII